MAEMVLRKRCRFVENEAIDPYQLTSDMGERTIGLKHTPAFEMPTR